MNSKHLLLSALISIVLLGCTGDTCHSNNHHLDGNADLEIADKINIVIDTSMTDVEANSLVNAINYYEKALDRDDLFEIIMVDVADHEYVEYENFADIYANKTIHVYKFPEGTPGLPVAHYARWNADKWNAQILYVDREDFTSEFFDVMWLHEIGHIVGLGHTDDLFDNAMNPNLWNGEFHLHDWQIDNIIEQGYIGEAK